MSLADDRAAFVAALETVTGVKAAYPMAPNRYQKGDAFPIFASLDSDGFGTGAITWVVTVVLGQDLGAAEDMIDAMLAELRAALRAVMTLGRFTVGTMDVSGGQIAVAQQTGIREYGA